MSKREVKADLVLLGRAPVPAPRPTFVRDLEARLASIAADDSSGVDVNVDIAPTARGRAGLAVAVALAVVMSTAGVAVVSSGNGRDVQTATVETASDTADDPALGSQLHAVDGTVDGHEGSTHSPSGSAFTSSRGGAPATTTAAGSGPLAVEGVASSVPSGAAAPGGASAAPAPLGLRGSGTPAYAFLEWDRYDGDGFAAYLVLRAAAPDDPAWPDESGRTLMLMRIDDRSTTRYEAQGKVGTTPRFRIVAVNRDGDVIATSGVFQADVGAGLGSPRDLEPLPGGP